MELTETREQPVQIRFPELTRASRLPLGAEPLTAEALAAQAVDTFGWDTVFAIRVEDVNATFAKPGVSPASWSHVDDPDDYYGSGTFGAWRMALGGGGENVNMSIPVDTGTMHFQGSDYPMDGSTARIQVHLQFVPASGRQSGGGKRVDLVMGGSAVVVQGLDDVPGDPPSHIVSLMRNLLEQWFNANADQFKHVFSSVNLNMKAEQDQFEWLMPTHTGYAYVDGVDEHEALFGILAMTENRDPTGAVHQFSPRTVPEGSRAGFAIAPERYLQKVLVPALPDLFIDASPSQFEVNESALQVENVERLVMTEVEAAGKTYKPDVKKGDFKARIEGEKLILDMCRVHAEFSPGVDMYMKFTSFYRLAIRQKSDGTHTIVFEEAQTPETDNWVELATWVVWTEVIASVVFAALCAFIGGKEGAQAILNTAARKIMAGVLAAILTGVIGSIGLILKAIATEDVDKLPSIDLLVLNCTSPVVWPGASEFAPDFAGLSMSFLIGGDPQFAD